MSIWTETTIACDFTSADVFSCPSEYQANGTEAHVIRYARRDDWTISRQPACQHPNPRPNPEDPTYGTCMDCSAGIHYSGNPRKWAGSVFGAKIPSTTHYEARCPKHARRRRR
jgi:hypothetical protein